MRYAERIAATMPDGLDAVFLVNSGSEANELAETRDAERRRLQAEIDELRAKVSSVRGSVADLAAAIPVTLDKIDEVLEEIPRIRNREERKKIEQAA